jgi:serine/threonine protein kinase
MGTQLQAPSVVTDLLGTMLEGRYRVHNLIAVGGMSVVFRGHHLRLKRDVAIKVLDPALGPGSSTRFLREAESAAQLDHPNCITVHDFGVSSTGLSFMVMPLLVGDTLRAREPGRWDAARAVRLVIEVLRGLDHAHGHGVIHRDLKPENIFICMEPNGTRVAKIVDFGLAKVIRGSEADSTTTMTGLMAGTPAYMSPEQALGLTVDERADLYSVGMILYELLAGSLPFQSDDGVALLRMQLHDQLPALPDDVPVPLIAIIEHLTAKERADRPVSARLALDMLEAFLRGDGHTMLAPALVRRATPELSSGTYPASVPDGATPTSLRNGAMPPESTLQFQDDDAQPQAPRGSRWWLWAAAGIATASAATVLAMTWAMPDRVAPAKDAAVTAVAVDRGDEGVGEAPADISDVTKLLALVNDAEFGAREGYVRRHELLGALARSEARDKIDGGLQAELDLLQAAQSPTPCKTFAAALDAIVKDGAAGHADALKKARVPDTAEDAQACVGLQERLDQLRAKGQAAAPQPVTAAAPEEPAVVAVADTKASKRAKARAAARGKRPAPASRPVAEPPAPAAEPPARTEPVKPSRKTNISKLDDELRPPE